MRGVNRFGRRGCDEHLESRPFGRADLACAERWGRVVAEGSPRVRGVAVRSWSRRALDDPSYARVSSRCPPRAIRGGPLPAVVCELRWIDGVASSRTKLAERVPRHDLPGYCRRLRRRERRDQTGHGRRDTDTAHFPPHPGRCVACRVAGCAPPPNSAQSRGRSCLRTPAPRAWCRGGASSPGPPRVAHVLGRARPTEEHQGNIVSPKRRKMRKPSRSALTTKSL
jgi:hypothetical protein